jgi:hypothetical protein
MDAKDGTGGSVRATDRVERRSPIADRRIDVRSLAGRHL